MNILKRVKKPATKLLLQEIPTSARRLYWKHSYTVIMSCTRILTWWMIFTTSSWLCLMEKLYCWNCGIFHTTKRKKNKHLHNTSEMRSVRLLSLMLPMLKHSDIVPDGLTWLKRTQSRNAKSFLLVTRLISANKKPLKKETLTILLTWINLMLSSVAVKVSHSLQMALRKQGQKSPHTGIVMKSTHSGPSRQRNRLNSWNLITSITVTTKLSS